MTHTLLDSRHVASPAGARLCSVSTPKIARKLGYFDDDVGWACTAEVFLDAGYGIASNRRNSVACGPLQSRLRVRIDCAPPPSPRVCGFSARISQIARDCGVICRFGGTGENHFRAVCGHDAAKVSVGK